MVRGPSLRRAPALMLVASREGPSRPAPSAKSRA
jgi:hypothetical protein